MFRCLEKFVQLYLSIIYFFKKTVSSCGGTCFIKMINTKKERQQNLISSHYTETNHHDIKRLWLDLVHFADEPLGC